MVRTINSGIVSTQNKNAKSIAVYFESTGLEVDGLGDKFSDSITSADTGSAEFWLLVVCYLFGLIVDFLFYPLPFFLLKGNCSPHCHLTVNLDFLYLMVDSLVLRAVLPVLLLPSS